mgnify:CR=1 FL=1
MTSVNSKSFHILQIVIKNTSTLDFSLPILWGLRQKYPNATISIVYTCLNKHQILRNSNFMRNFCVENKVQQYDFCDYIFPVVAWLAPIFRHFFAGSYSDRLNISELKDARSNGFLLVIKALLVPYVKIFDKIISSIFVDAEQILVGLSPDIVLFDNRSVTNGTAHEAIYKYLEAVRKPVVLLPHAPHYNGETAEFCRFDKDSDDLMPDYTEHWMPFRYGEPWKIAPSHHTQFIKIGYPGLDDSWWRYLLSRRKENTKIQCLVMSRKFLPENMMRPDGFDESTLDYEEAFGFLKMLDEAVRNINIEIEIILKPHPSSSEPENMNMLRKVGLENYSISYESFFDLIPSIDIVVSQFTTALSLPIAAGIPTMLVETKLQRSVHRRWDILADYYSNLKYYSQPYEFASKFDQLIAEACSSKKSNIDRQHLRKFFDDGSVEQAISRVEYLLGGQHGTS